MSPLQIALPVFGLSQSLITMIVLWRDCRQFSQARIFALLLLCCPAYLFNPLVDSGTSAYQLALEATRTALPGMVWLVSYSLFTERFRLRLKHCLAVAFTVAMPLVGGILGGRVAFQAEGNILGMWLWWHIPQWLEIALLSHACYLILSHWRDDLVEARRSLRVFVVGMIVAYTATVIFVEQFLGNSSKIMDLRMFVLFDLLLLALNIILLQWRHTELFVDTRPTAISPAPSGESGDALAAAQLKVETPPEISEQVETSQNIARLTALMEQGTYRRHGLTIGELAEELGWPEYRLRRLINGQLGYRNFNDFLNQYRIAEAARRLSDPQESHLPVLSIALDTGFRSLSSFNKAFKEALELTPTAYRKSALDPSATSPLAPEQSS